MAWSASVEFGPNRWEVFSFFKTWGIVTDVLSESVSLPKAWRLMEVRLHVSAAMGSAKYFQAKLSSVQDSCYDATIISLNYNGSNDIIWRFSDMSCPAIFLSGDTLNITGSVLSVANIHGLQIIGWAVID